MNLVTCPICSRRVARGAADLPFCSSRCRTIDFGRWVHGRYRVTSSLPTNLDADLPGVRSVGDQFSFSDLREMDAETENVRPD